MKTRSTLIALAVAASALMGFAATTSQAGVLGATTTIAVGYHGPHDNRPGDSGWNDHRDGRWDNRGSRQEDRGVAIAGRIRMVQTRIDQGRRDGSLSRREALRMQGRLNDIVTEKRAYERSGHGLSREEIATVNFRLDDLSSIIGTNRHDDNRW